MKRIVVFTLTISIILLITVGALAKKIEVEVKYRENELIEIVKLDPTIKLDIRYATKNNFLGRCVYKVAKAYLQNPVAQDLVKANKELKPHGYGFLIFDGYRPWSVTKLFWDEIHPSKRQFVADPKVGSIHNRGCAIDLTLYDLKTGKEIKMPSQFDEFNKKAYPTYKSGTKEEIKNRDFLINIMKKYNFTVHSQEWWHYNHKDCNKYQILDLSFEEIRVE